MNATRKTCRLFATSILSVCAGSASALDKKPVVTLDLAKKLIAGCEAKAQEQGWKMNIAIVDNGANLVAFERMDGGLPRQHLCYATQGDYIRRFSRSLTRDDGSSLWERPAAGEVTRDSNDTEHCPDPRRFTDHNG
jgi:hypothetical protein